MSDTYPHIKGFANMPTVSDMRRILNEIEAEHGADQHIDVKHIANQPGALYVIPVNPVIGSGGSR